MREMEIILGQKMGTALVAMLAQVFKFLRVCSIFLFLYQLETVFKRDAKALSAKAARSDEAIKPRKRQRMCGPVCPCVGALSLHARPLARVF